MKTLFLSLAIIFAALIAQAQSATNVTITAVVKLNNGLSYTNSVSNGNTNILAAATNAMTKFNFTRANEDPPKAATTNLAHFLIEFVKVEFKNYTNNYDADLVQKLNVKLPTMTEQKKSELRAIVEAP